MDMLLVIFVFTSLFVSLLTGTPPWARTFSDMTAVFTISLSLYFTYPIVFITHEALATRRLYKKFRLKYGMYTFRYKLYTKNSGYILLLIPLILFLLVARWFLHIDYSLMVFLPIVIFEIYILALHMTPPAVLLLANSRPQSIALFNYIESGIHPYRLVCALDPLRAERSRHSPDHWDRYGIDNVRIPSFQDWRAGVHRISTRVPLVVVDTRIASEGVVWETRERLKKSVRDRTSFLLNNDGSARPIISARRARSSLRLTSRPGRIIGTAWPALFTAMVTRGAKTLSFGNRSTFTERSCRSSPATACRSTGR